jgi:adenylosuccinate lyase
LKGGAGTNDLLERIGKDAAFGMSADELTNLARAEEFVGLSPQQVAWFIESEVDPVLERHAGLVTSDVGEVRV